jgi:predicted phage tail protein
MKKNRIISGSGGGGGKGGGGKVRVAVESADSLQSKAFVQIIDLVGEGEIEGLVNGLKSVYLDGTPLENADGTYNFPGFEMETRSGTQDQGYIEGFPSTEKEVQVNTESKFGVPVVRTITNSEVDAVRVRVSMPQMTYQDPTNGDLSGTEVAYAIEVQANGGGYLEKVRDIIIGKCVSKYERSYRIELTGEGPWDVRLVRLSEDSASQTLQNKTVFEAYTEIVDGKLRYPNSAVVAVKVDASQFSSVPVRAYDMKLLRVKVPTNYDPVTRSYSGSWDGLFYIAWTDNPAWIFYDLVTSERYGLGSFIPEDQIDKWSLYTIARYCDELVPDGFGGTEPRFTCNLYLQTRAEAYKVIQDLASIFRGMAYWAQGTLTVVQDAPDDPAFLFNSSNVLNGVFSYQGSSAKARHTVALVTWNDPDDSYRQKVEYVEDADAIARYGIIETQVVAFGCTSRGQASRVGKWLLYTERFQTETVTFRTGLNGSTCRPGQIILVSDPARAGSRRGGRILSASGATINVDQNMAIDPSTHTFSALLPNGTVEEKQILSASLKQIILTSAFSQDPLPGSVWMVASAEVEPQYFKIINIMEVEGGVHEITALAHNPDKYDSIERDLKLEPRSISSLSTVPDSPSSIIITETLYEVNGAVRVKVTASWNPVSGATGYLVQWKRDSLNWSTLPETSTNEVEVLNAEPGEYTFKVVALNSLGSRSVPSTATREVKGKALPPASVQSFSLIPNAGRAELSWEKSVDLDVLIGGSVRIRWTPETDAPVWRNSIDILPAQTGNSTRASAPLLAGTYMAKFIDSSGVASDEEAIIITTVPEPLKLNVVETITESPSFPGVKDSMSFFPSYEGIALEAAFKIDEILGDIDDVINFDFAGGVADEGTYNFSSVVDLGDSFSSKITAHLLAEAVDVADTIDQREEVMDDWVDLDGDFIDDVNAEIFLQTTDDDPSSLGAVWSDWKPFFVGEYKARGIKFQVRVSSDSREHNLVIKELAMIIDMPDRVVVPSANIISGAGIYTVTYDGAFIDSPAVGITANDLNSGDYYRIINQTRTGFQIFFKDSGGTYVSRSFSYMAKGYGRQVA